MSGRVHPRVTLGLAVVAAVVASLVTHALVPDEGRTVIAMLSGYLCGSVIFLLRAGALLARADHAQIRDHATIDDPGRATMLAIVLGSGMLVVGGALTALRGASGESPTHGALVLLTLAAMVLAWLVTNVAYALHYAHLHFRAPPPGGIDFAGDDEPDGLDFAYLAFTVGMTFQVSDMKAIGRDCRRAILAHGLLAFGWNTLIVAGVINATVSQLQQS